MKKNILLMAAILFVLLIAAPVHGAAADTFENNSNATFTVVYETPEASTYLVLVENLDTASKTTQYYYKLDEGQNEMIVPLTEGSGEYLIRLCRIIAGGRALVVKKWNTDVADRDSETVFSIPSVIVDYGISDAAILKAASLTKGCKDDTAKIKKIYKYVYKNFAYDYELLAQKTGTAYYVPSIGDTFSRKLGICYDISAVMAGMLRSVGIEACIVTGYTPNVSQYHAWNRVYDSTKNKWYTIDGTYDMCIYGMGGKTSMIKDDDDYSDIVYTY